MLPSQLVPPGTNTLPATLQALIAKELQNGEHVVWSEQPIAARAALDALPVLVFAVPWTAFSLFWVTLALKGVWKGVEGGNWASLGFPLFGVPFVGIGFGLLSAPYVSYRGATGSVNVLTNRRAIIFHSTWRGSVVVRSFERSRLAEVRRTERADGSGDLVFSQEPVNSGGSERRQDVGFVGVRNVKAVEDAVRGLASEAP